MASSIAQSQRLDLPQVTLCAATSINVAATLRAMRFSSAKVRFAACKLLTDVAIEPGCSEIEVVKIAPIRTAEAYSRFVLRELVDHVATSHCLIIQWDGHVHNAGAWSPEFLNCDYLGASWPQFADSHDVGNGGFSLRSRRLMEMCRDPAFVGDHPEDLAIGRTNRAWLESHGMRFATRAMADQFAAERASDPRISFGYHGIWNMGLALGPDALWTVYCELDSRLTVHRDFRAIVCQILRGRHGTKRALRMLLDRIFP